MSFHLIPLLDDRPCADRRGDGDHRPDRSHAEVVGRVLLMVGQRHITDDTVGSR